MNPVAGIPPKSVMVCGSKDRGFMTGTAGRMTYRIKDKQVPANDVLLTWSNPFVGRNKASGSAYFTAAPALRLPSTRYRVVVTCGAGAKDAEMRYTVRPL